MDTNTNLFITDDNGITYRLNGTDDKQFHDNISFKGSLFDEGILPQLGLQNITSSDDDMLILEFLDEETNERSFIKVKDENGDGIIGDNEVVVKSVDKDNTRERTVYNANGTTTTVKYSLFDGNWHEISSMQQLVDNTQKSGIYYQTLSEEEIHDNTKNTTTYKYSDAYGNPKKRKSCYLFK